MSTNLPVRVQLPQPVADRYPEIDNLIGAFLANPCPVCAAKPGEACRREKGDIVVGLEVVGETWTLERVHVRRTQQEAGVH